MKKCEICGSGKLQKKKVKNYAYKTSLGTITVAGTVEFLECDSCKENMIPGDLIQEWNGMILEHLATKKSFISPMELKFIFSVLPYSQAEIASATGKDRSTLTKYKTGENPIDPLFDHTLREIIVDYVGGRSQTFGLLKARHEFTHEDKPLKKIHAA